MNEYRKGRGAQIQIGNRFDKDRYEPLDEFLNYCHHENESVDDNRTTYTEVYPRTIINEIKSPDLRMEYSLNPYQGCEHGCVYCYARISHEYWGYGGGLDFERKILVKKNAPQLLEEKLLSRNWKAATIVLSGNTDCYQPLEKKLEITRKCLEIFVRYRHPVGIITKNALILRDLDLLRDLASDTLVGVNISITTLSEKTRQLLEPRTATIARRLEAVSRLSSAGIPVNVMLAPIIPGINSHEMLPLAKAAADAGAVSVGHTMVRLNGMIAELFTDWLQKALPDRAEKVLNQIKSVHGGTLNDSQYGRRMKGEGAIAEQIAGQIALARKKYFSDRSFPQLNTSLFAERQSGQYTLFK